MGDQPPRVVADQETPPPFHEPDRAAQVGEVHLVYKFEGTPDDVPVLELARTLEALGVVVQEANRALNPNEHDIVVKVKPFEEGSFLMDLVMSVQNNPALLFFLTQPEAIRRIKEILEYVGLIKGVRETLLDLIEFLNGKKPQAVSPTENETVTYTNNDGQQFVVNGNVSQLYQNPVINNYYFNALGGNAMDREGVEGVMTMIRGDEHSRQFVARNAAPALRAYSQPEPEAPRIEVVDNETVEFLNPKAGTYGSTEGTWTFLPAGKKRGSFKARITDQGFLHKFQAGRVRFYQNDVLKVRLRTEQTLKNGTTTKKYEIIEVLDYQRAPVQRTAPEPPPALA